VPQSAASHGLLRAKYAKKNTAALLLLRRYENIKNASVGDSRRDSQYERRIRVHRQLRARERKKRELSRRVTAPLYAHRQIRADRIDKEAGENDECHTAATVSGRQRERRVMNQRHAGAALALYATDMRQANTIRLSPLPLLTQ